MSEERSKSLNFIEQILENDLESGKHGGRILTRFPPEPNGYLHIGHVKAICLNFLIAEKYGGKTNLRFDDTNPVTEDTEYVESIKKDIQWLGFDWEDREFFASDYFDQLFEFACKLIQDGKAYIDDSSSEEMAAMKGTATKPGTNSPYRDRSIDENMALFKSMKAGEFDEGTKVLRAKIDMASPNLLMRDPVIYRIKKAHHHRTGDDWFIYPMYDFAHGQSDSVEKITHSLCTLEFENHRPLYNWFIQNLDIFPSRQIEFARLNLNYTITSKRKLLQLVTEGLVTGWDDPRMPTVSGMRRRGYTPTSLRNFADKAGIAKRENIIEMGLLEFCVREDLNKISSRVMVVHDPVKLIITNYLEGKTETLSSVKNPEDPAAGHYEIPFSKEIYIERGDFMEDPPKKFFRLGPGRNVRLKNAYIIQCQDFKKNPDTGEIEEIYCTYYDNSKSGQDVSGIKAKGTLHWVSAAQSVPIELRLYDRLFNDPTPTGHKDREYIEFFNEDSLTVSNSALADPSIYEAKPGMHYQFLRKGYYTMDPDSTDDKLIFNRTVGLRDSWAKKK